MKKRILLSLFCCLLSFSMFAQNEGDEYHTFRALKFHANIGLWQTSFISTESPKFINSNAFVSPGIGLFWRKEHRYVEVSLSDFYFRTKESVAGGFKEKFMFTSIRAERGWRWGRSSKPLQFFLGYALQPTFQMYRLNPITTNLSPIKSYAVGLRAAFTPKISYRLSQDWVLDFTLNIHVSDFNIGKRGLNPLLPSNEQQQVSFDFTTLNPRRLYDNLVIKLGVGKVF